MARAKKVADSRPEWVQVRVAKSFEVLVRGEEMQTSLTDRVVSLVAGGFLEVTEYGPSASGPGTAVAGDQGGSPQDTAPEGSPGAEPGQDFGAGGYGQAP